MFLGSELLLEFLDLELPLEFPDLELALGFQALGQVQVSGLQGWAEMTPELRGGRPLPCQHMPQPIIVGLAVNSPFGSPEQSEMPGVADEGKPGEEAPGCQPSEFLLPQWMGHRAPN